MVCVLPKSPDPTQAILLGLRGDNSFIQRKNLKNCLSMNCKNRKKNDTEYNTMNETYVHGIVKNMWIGICSASATCVCPEQAFIQVRNHTQGFLLCIEYKYYDHLDSRKAEDIKKKKTASDHERGNNIK